MVCFSLLQLSCIVDGAKTVKVKEIRKSPFIKPNRMKPCDDIPSAEELMAIKHRKRVGHQFL